MSENKEYLGDSVYADYDGWTITLTTENGYGPSNTIHLEPQVLQALNRYAERHGTGSPERHATTSATVAALTQRNEDLQNTIMQALNAIELGAPSLARETLQKALRGEVAKTASEQGPVPF